MLLWATAGIPLGVYNIVEDFNIALQIQPQLLTVLSLITWIQCKYYGNKWSLTKSTAIVAPVALIMGGIEYALVFALRKARDDEIEWPATFMAVLSACLLCAGVLRHYWDIYKERTVRGISWLFVFIDAMGDLTSLISVFFQSSLDILGMIIYGSELVLWLGVFACGGYCKSISHTSNPDLLINTNSVRKVNFRPWLNGQKEKYRNNRHEGSTNGEYAAGGHAGDQRDELAESLSRQSSTVFRTASASSHVSSDQGNLRLRTVSSHQES